MTKFSVSSNKWTNKVIPLFFVLFAATLFSHLGRDPLYDWDESIYGQLGVELLKSHNLFTNFWNGSTWFEKPPGISWLAATGISLVGGELGARLFMPIISAITLYVVYLIGKKLENWQTGAIASGLLGSLNLFLDRTRVLNTDMPLLLGMTASFALLLYGASPVYFAIAIALSIWFKGLAGLMSIVITLPLLLSKGKKYILHFTLYTLLFISPWHLYSYLKYGMEFLRPYLLEQVLTRALNPIEFHLESRWYYFEFLYSNLGVGVLFVTLVGVILSVRNYLIKKDVSRLYVIWWLLAPLVLFTLAKTRLYWYILPLYPALAILSAQAVTNISEGKSSKALLTVIALGVLLQSLLGGYRYTDPTRSTPTSTPSQELVNKLSVYNTEPLAFLVPQSERTAEAILPHEQRISSSFRYGGSPSTVYYYGGHVEYFYNTDQFEEYIKENPLSPVMVSRGDKNFVDNRDITIENKSYIGAVNK